MQIQRSIEGIANSRALVAAFLITMVIWFVASATVERIRSENGQASSISRNH